MDKLTKYIIAIGIQTAIIFFIIIFRVAVITGGTEVVLKIEPADPTSPLRGDYATFQYSSISNIAPYIVVGTKPRNGDTIYVILRQSGNYWVAQKAQTEKPAGSNEVFLKGKVASGGLQRQADSLTITGLGTSSLHIIYGIEEYFIPEGTGRNFSFQNKETAARVAVDDDGNAVLKSIIVNGKPWP